MRFGGGGSLRKIVPKGFFFFLKKKKTFWDNKIWKFCEFIVRNFVVICQGNPKGGLAKGGLARKAPIGPKRALSGKFLLFPRACGVRRNWSRSAPKRPRQALKRLQSAPKRPDFPGRISPRFSLKTWGLSPRL